MAEQTVFILLWLKKTDIPPCLHIIQLWKSATFGDLETTLGFVVTPMVALICCGQGWGVLRGPTEWQQMKEEKSGFGLVKVAILTTACANIIIGKKLNVQEM